MRRAVLLLFALLAPIGVFAAMIAADRTFGQPGRGWDYVVTILMPDASKGGNLPRVLGPQDASRPLVVIDPGHGGKDPGAGQGELKEKDLTLALALALRDELLARGGIRVALTREDDRFLILTDRGNIARQLGADLFISIHADSTEVASGASGATIYTLSEKGSNEAAERIAARENAVDEVNGVRLDAQAREVQSVLVDLSQRGSLQRSIDFARLVLRQGQGRLPLREDEPQSAAFVVLKGPDLPSVLFESGYINNDDDLARLTSAEGRKAFAQVLGEAIRIHFARQAVPQIGM